MNDTNNSNKKQISCYLTGSGVIAFTVLTAITSLLAISVCYDGAKYFSNADVNDLEGKTEKYDCVIYSDPDTWSDFAIVGFTANTHILIVKIVDIRTESLMDFHRIFEGRENLRSLLNDGELTMPHLTVDYSSNEKIGDTLDYAQNVQLLDDFSRWATTA